MTNTESNQRHDAHIATPRAKPVLSSLKRRYHLMSQHSTQSYSHFADQELQLREYRCLS